MSDSVLYKNAFIDFQKYGKREENAILWTLSQIEIDQAQFRLKMIKDRLYAPWKNYKIRTGGISAYDIDEDKTEHMSIEDAFKICTFWDMMEIIN